MPYTPTDWVDNATPVNAANMDKLEQGVVDAHAGLPPSPTGQNGKWLTVSGGAMVWQTLPAESLPVTTFDAKGDILAASAADTVGRLAVGSNGQVLTADSPSALGVKWAAAAAAETLPVTIMDAKGDLIAATAADAAARLAVGSNNQVLTADSAQTTGMKWATPSSGGGGELAYVQVTTGVSVTSTSEAAPNDVLTFGAVTFDGSTIVVLEWHCPYAAWGSGGVSPSCIVNLWSGTTYPTNIIGRIWVTDFTGFTGSNMQINNAAHAFFRFTPPAGTFTYRIRANVSGAAPMAFNAGTGAGGAVGFTPMWARIVRA